MHIQLMYNNSLNIHNQQHTTHNEQLTSLTSWRVRQSVEFTLNYDTRPCYPGTLSSRLTPTDVYIKVDNNP
jgi:hypothetical protein